MYDHKEIEGWTQRFWIENKIYEKVKNLGSKRFEFIDGPPFVTGEIHPGTAWNKCIKDAILRFYRMRGYSVNDTPGYDTHGLPIEVKVEKKLGIENKSQIESEIGIERFVKECKEFAENYRKIMTEQLKKFHVWMDWDKPYITFTRDYIERSWKTMKRAWDRGLLREGDYVVPYCYRCQTTLANYELEYVDMEDPSIYVMFPTYERDLYLLIWTTTPWTLVANLGVMVNPKEKYVEIERDGKRMIVAKKRYEELKMLKDWKIRREMDGKELEGLRYRHPFEDLIGYKFDRKVILSEEYVSMEDGTGLVHTAPGHGEEDFKVGMKYRIPTFSFVDDEGRYIEAAGERFRGKVCRETNDEIIGILKERGLLFRKETIKHSYPTCWRCKTPLIYRSTHQWFITISELRDRMIEQAKSTKWIPEFAMKRFVNFLQSSPDWCISRQRYWGIPLPIWKCEKCGHVEVLDKIPDGVEDPHRPYIDRVELKCSKCGGVMRRVPDVLDVWFDSGNAVWASTGKDVVADYIVEGQDQIRGWFYSLLGSGMIYYDRIPYRAVGMHGFFVDEKGEKMSKSVGNYVPVEQILEKVGADAFRLFGLSNNIWEDLKFNWRDLELAKRELFVMLNISKYIEEAGDTKGSDKEIWDRWVEERLKQLKKIYIESFESFQYYVAVRELRDFMMEDLSRFYMKMVKGKSSSIAILRKVFLELLVMFSPIVPATTEYIYQKLYRSEVGKESIFMMSIEDPEGYDEELLKRMSKAREIISKILEWRQRSDVPLRMPVSKIIIEGDLAEMDQVIAIMTNAKEVVFQRVNRADIQLDGFRIEIEKGDTEEEWLFNEISRRIQFFRKQLGLKRDERIVLNYSGSGRIESIIEKYIEELEERTRSKLVRGDTDGGTKYEIRDLELTLKRVS